MSLARAERALENRAYVRVLLRLRPPAFAAALESRTARGTILALAGIS